MYSLKMTILNPLCVQTNIMKNKKISITQKISDLQLWKSLQCLAWEQTSGFFHLLLPLICCKPLVEVFEEHLDSHRYVPGKGESLTAFSELWAAFLDATLNSNKRWFLKGSLHCGMWPHQRTRYAQCCHPVHCVLCFEWNFRPHMLSHIGHLENPGSPNDAALQTPTPCHALSASHSSESHQWSP